MFSSAELSRMLSTELGQCAFTKKGGLIRIKRPRTQQELDSAVNKYGPSVYWVNKINGNVDNEIVNASVDGVML